ncbi:hypothetical protein, partial [Bradyrhizobium sp.]|uniref:hypothetical protein n=1 Tax=Bradyrhizobium sp. TaxID=376 RepID=UPI003C24C66E
HSGSVGCLGGSDLDQGCAHGPNQSKSERRLQGLSLIISKPVDFLHQFFRRVVPKEDRATLNKAFFRRLRA